MSSIYGNHNRKRIPTQSKFDWRTIFLRNSGGISSKRIIALLGAFICFGILVAGYIQQKEIPEFANVVFIGCLGLYGVDVIPSGLWSKTINKEE